MGKVQGRRDETGAREEGWERCKGGGMRKVQGRRDGKGAREEG